VDCLSDPHQILCEGDYVLITNTGRNCLTVVRRADLFYRHVWFDEARWDCKGPDRPVGKHLNSVQVVGDRLYVLAHNFERGSLIAELTWPGLELVQWHPTRAYQAHNLWAQPGGEILTCNTIDGSVIEAVSGRVLWRSRTPTLLTRGLACSGNYIFVGMSTFAKRQDRTRTDGGVWVLDRDTWKEIDFLPLPASGNVREIRIVDHPDECHHGQVLKNLPTPFPARTAAFEARAATRGTIQEGVWAMQYGDVTFEGNDVRAGEGPTLVTRISPVLADVAVSVRIDDVPPGPWLTPWVGPATRWLKTRLAGGDAAGERRHAGLVARYRGAGDSNMVCVQIEVVTPKPVLTLRQNVNNQWQRLGVAYIDGFPADVRLEAVGPRLTVLVNGRRVISATTSVLEAGLVGVRGQTVGRYSDFQAEALAAEQAPAAKAA
jgi:hypothetical protein